LAPPSDVAQDAVEFGLEGGVGARLAVRGLQVVERRDQGLRT
jgi:hypothetical protein